MNTAWQAATKFKREGAKSAKGLTGRSADCADDADLEAKGAWEEIFADCEDFEGLWHR